MVKYACLSLKKWDINSQVISLLFSDSNVNKVPETKMEKYQRLDHIEIWMFQSRDLRPLKIRL